MPYRPITSYAGAIARFVIGPLDVLKIRFQVQLEPIKQAAAGSKQSLSKYTGVKQALKLIVREEGIQVLNCYIRDGRVLTSKRRCPLCMSAAFVRLVQLLHAVFRRKFVSKKSEVSKRECRLAWRSMRQ